MDWVTGSESCRGKLSRRLQVRVLSGVPESISTVSVAQLVELRIVVPAVGGSKPLAHPNLNFSRAVSSVGRAADS